MRRRRNAARSTTSSGWPPPRVKFPKGGFLHPFHKSSPGIEGRQYPRTIVESRMCELSHDIRETPFWWEEMKDEVNLEKWKREALDRTGDEGFERVWRLTPAMVNYVLEELQGYADLRDPETGIEVGPAERIWKSDSLIPDSLRRKLLAAVAPLENAPDSKQDWRPGSDGLTLDLVDPSLYPIVINLVKPTLRPIIPMPPMRRGPESLRDAKYAYSEFQWLPSDFFAFPNGKVMLASPYINNVHPIHHKVLYSIIPEVLQLALPMFERVLSDTIRPLLRMRIRESNQVAEFETAGCIWGDNAPDFDAPAEGEHLETILEKYDFKTPDAKGHYDGDLEVMKDRISFGGRALQVIVKLTNIVLTPEKPHYPGEEWHVEGMRNEKIVSSFIYCYDSENVTEGRLAFRRATCRPYCCRKYGSSCVTVLYDMDRDSALVQDVGNFVLTTRRCVAFPNLYQHQVQPFELEDPTKPGHMKMLVLFLVDPTQRIPSATDVAPQQREWVVDAMRGAGANSLFARLPAEILTMIAEEVNGTMSRSEAEMYMGELVAERAAFTVKNDEDYFGMR